jgi:hypothetical protein
LRRAIPFVRLLLLLLLLLLLFHLQLLLQFFRLSLPPLLLSQLDIPLPLLLILSHFQPSQLQTLLIRQHLLSHATLLAQINLGRQFEKPRPRLYFHRRHDVGAGQLNRIRVRLHAGRCRVLRRHLSHHAHGIKLQMQRHGGFYRELVHFVV